MVKFTKNGSTAVSAAVKLARAYTGRDLVARCADHAFFSYDDWLGNSINQVVLWTRSFWQRVSDGIQVQDLWEQFISEARASYSLYSREAT